MNKLWGLLVVLLLPLFVISSSAVTLPLAPTNSLETHDGNACTDTTLSSSADSAGNFTIADLPASCDGLPLMAVAYASSAPTETTFTGTSASGTITFASPLIGNGADVIGVIVSINGWFIPSSWTWNGTTTDPITPDPSYPGISVGLVWNQMAATQVCVQVTVTTSSTTPIPWAVNLHYTMLPFNGDTNGSHFGFSPYGYGFVSNTPVDGMFTAHGTIASTVNVSSGSPRVFNICNYNAPPPGISSTATYYQTETTPSASWWVCKTVTVSVTGAPFYVGWESQVNVSDLQALYLGTGGSYHAPTGGFTSTALGGNNYLISGNGWNTRAVRDDTSVSYSVCWG